jgi:hypothetical protein
MQINIGSADRALRMGIGVLLVGLAVTDVIGAWGYIGIVPLVTGAFRFCPACRLFGLDTCAMDKR